MLKQGLHLKLQQKLSPQQIQLMKMLQLPTVALEQRIKEEMETNPALDEGAEDIEDQYDEDLNEEYGETTEAQEDFDYSEYLGEDDTPSYKLSVSNKGRDDEERDIPYSSGKSFHEILEAQLGLRILTAHEEEVAVHLIGNIDESGYLRRDLEAIVDDLAFSQNIMTSVEELENLLSVIHELDPPGVGARSLQECLLIQLEKKEATVAIETAKVVLEKHFDEFTKKHYNKIIDKLEIQNEDLKRALDEITKLNPKPGNSLNETQRTVEHVVPDFYIAINDEELELSMNSRNTPELKVSGKYNEMIETYMANKGKNTRAEKEALMFIKQKIDSAKWFIDAIMQRQNTLQVTMSAIMEHQKGYFLTGDETKLKPMILKDIAEKVDLDISTISRVANSKYVQTPFGTFLLKSFFSESLTNDSGEEVSTREVKKILSDAVDDEDKKSPLTDEKLAQLLKQKSYNIARRTVAKYREQLNIPVARLRREL
ncbi:RNA polymerase factor sigma-54 [Flavobacteriales bacterium]|nr:RNA polymerase factor sigma-54 [Flavobacteriales bacterium]